MLSRGLGLSQGQCQTAAKARGRAGSTLRPAGESSDSVCLLAFIECRLFTLSNSNNRRELEKQGQTIFSGIPVFEPGLDDSASHPLLPLFQWSEPKATMVMEKGFMCPAASAVPKFTQVLFALC